MHERFFSSHEFSYEKCSEIFPEFFEPLFCGSERIPGKFPPNFPLNFPNFPAKNQKKITDELLQEFWGSAMHIHDLRDPQKMKRESKERARLAGLLMHIWHAQRDCINSTLLQKSQDVHHICVRQNISGPKKTA